MNRTYRKVAVAAGVFVAALAARKLRHVSTKRNQQAEAMTITLDRASGVRARSARQLLRSALLCDERDLRVSASFQGNVVCWTDAKHPERSGRFALVPADDEKSTELHLVMRTGRRELRDVIARLAALLQSGEFAMA